VHWDAVRPREGDDLLDRLERADLVVGPHHRDQRDACRVALDGGAQRVEVEATEPVHGQQLDVGAVLGRQPVQRVQDGVVLDGGREDPGATRVRGTTCPEDPLEGQVVGLGAAGGEHHLTRPAVQRLRDRLPRLLDHPAGVPPGRVQRARVADVVQVLGHRLDRRRHHRRGGGVVEIDGLSGRAHSRPSLRRG